MRRLQIKQKKNGGMGLKILVPAAKTKKNISDCVKRAIAAADGSKHSIAVSKNNYDVKYTDEYVYYPYWIMRVDGYKMRLFAIGNEAMRKFYITCDAIDGSFIVLQSTPKTREIEVTEDCILDTNVSEKQLKGPILKEAVVDRINRQFIFGKPRTEPGAVIKVYLPMYEIFVKRKDQLEYKPYYVNAYTGEIKTEQ